MFRSSPPPTWAQNLSVTKEPVRSGRRSQIPAFVLYEGPKGTKLGEGLNFCFSPLLPAVNFTATPETCSGKVAGARGPTSGHSTTLAGSQGQKGRGRGSQPRAGPRLPPNLGRGFRRSGSSSDSDRGFPRRKPQGGSAGGRRGGDAADRQLKGTPRGGLHRLPSFTPLASPSLRRRAHVEPQPSEEALPATQLGAAQGHSGLGRPRRAAQFWGYGRCLPFFHPPRGPGGSSRLGRIGKDVGPTRGK